MNKTKFLMLLLILFISFPAFSEIKKLKQNRNKNQYIEYDLSSKNDSGRSGSFLESSILSNVDIGYKNKRSYLNSPSLNVSRNSLNNYTPLITQNNYYDTGSMKAPAFPGDPGQMPLSDGMWFLLGVAAIFAIYKHTKV